MRRFILIFVVLAVVPAYARTATPLTTVRQIRELPAAEAERGIPVELNAVVTYYNAPEHILFVQDKTGPIFVEPTQMFSFVPGDRIRVRGVTMGSFHTDVASDDLHVIGRGSLPKPAEVTYQQLITGDWDCAYVTVSGRVLSATMQQTIGVPFLLLAVRMDGGELDVHMEHPEGLDLHALLDSDVMLTGIAGGRFDGKFQLVGANLYLSSPAALHVTARAAADISALPLTPISRILGTYEAAQRSPRVRIRGTVTLYEPGTQLVMERNGDAALVHTFQKDPLKIGEVVYASGFADPNDYTQSLQYGQFTPTQDVLPVKPQSISWQDALTGKYALNLVSLEGELVEQAHEAGQETLFINSGGHIFSAVLRHPGNHQFRMTRYRIGSQVRVTGVCFVYSGGPWHGPMSFNLHLRGAGDVQVLKLSSWWTVQHLMYIAGALLAIVLVALAWAALLRRRVYEQTLVIRRTMKYEAERDRRQAFLEKQRSRVLEAINSLMPLEEVLSLITRLITEQTGGVDCRCELANGVCVGAEPSEAEVNRAHEERREILSGSGERLGELVLFWNELGPRFGAEMIDIGASLAGLAMDNRRLYEGLVQRSEYDQLTEIPNRFLLEQRLIEVMADARLYRRKFALIYIDLDRFKAVNDQYGHRIGDMYLQDVAKRLHGRLREVDTLARVGGDEFIVLIPAVADRRETEEIASRLESCFDSPFRVDACTIEGSASVGVAVYPEDGEDPDQLKRVADAAMYAGKQRASGLGLR